MQASHPQTNLCSSVLAFCLALIVSSSMPAHGETARLAIAPAPHSQRQVNNVGRPQQRAINLTVNNEKIRFNLPKGVTSFVIPLSSPNQQRCFTLENGNVTAKGTFSIATASKPLAANDANWNVVAGAVRFRQKRQFYLSLVGVEAKFVRLTFQIDGPGKSVQAR